MSGRTLSKDEITAGDALKAGLCIVNVKNEQRKMSDSGGEVLIWRWAGKPGHQAFRQENTLWLGLPTSKFVR